MCSQIDQTMYEHVYEAVGEEQEMKTETETERVSAKKHLMTLNKS